MGYILLYLESQSPLQLNQSVPLLLDFVDVVRGMVLHVLLALRFEGALDVAVQLVTTQLDLVELCLFVLPGQGKI